jgi:hypothetical protein
VTNKSARRALMDLLLEEAHAPLYRLMIDHGVSFEAAPLPPEIEPGEKNCCFYDAYRLASSQPNRYTYYDGFGIYEFPTAEYDEWSSLHAHAWCVAGDSVVDPTWVDS